MKKGYFEIREISRPLRQEIGEYLEINLTIFQDYEFLDDLVFDLEIQAKEGSLLAALVANQRLLNYTRKVIQLTEEKIAFESKKTIDTVEKVA